MSAFSDEKSGYLKISRDGRPLFTDSAEAFFVQLFFYRDHGHIKNTYI
jgi:hypothetical protein